MTNVRIKTEIYQVSGFLTNLCTKLKRKNCLLKQVFKFIEVVHNDLYLNRVSEGKQVFSKAI